VAALGAGGMGEVYRARDTRLKRDVALKILPESFASDPERLARFQREAELLAALNHPHIAQIYGVEESTGVRALIMELIDGETLADRIARGAIPFDEALPIAKQIAEALAAAHEQGIIHRDLKPANIKVRPDGAVKVLDFGLGKLAESQSSSPTDPTTVSMSPTITSPVSGVGVLLGTAAYMSPEQAKGKPADRRSDIWAFGCVIYEMLTSRRAFDGEDIPETLANVLTAQPQWSTLPRTTPASIRRLLRRCLEKDRQQRLQHIGDGLIDIRDAAVGSDLSEPEAAPASQMGSRERMAWAIAAISTVAAVAVGARIGRSQSVASGYEPGIRLELNTAPTADSVSLALSPDGRSIVFVGTQDGRSRLWLRPLDATAARPLDRTEGSVSPFWSPDSRAVGYFSQSKLRYIDIATGSVQTIADARSDLGASWGNGGTIIFAPGPSSPLVAVPATGGPIRHVTALENGATGDRWPQFLPDGTHFLFYRSGPEPIRGIYIGSVNNEPPSRLLDGDVAAPVFVAGGALMFVRQGSLFLQPFDAGRRTLGGSAAPIAQQVAVDSRAHAALGVAADGTVVYRTTAANNRRQFTWFDRSGKSLGSVGEADENRSWSPSMSHDGTRIALHRTVDDNVDIWLLDIRRQVLNRVTSDVVSEVNARWANDDSRLAFGSFRNGRFELHVRTLADGKEESLGVFGTPQDWSPDGHFLLFSTGNNGSPANTLFGMRLDDRKPFQVASRSRDGQFSPDGKWIIYQSDESGRSEVYLQPFPGPGARTQLSDAGGAQPRWGSGGREVFYIGLDERLMAVSIKAANNGERIEVGTPTPLFEVKVGGALQDVTTALYTVSSDGQRFLVSTLLEQVSASPIVVILKRLEPNNE
jgi:serine/threonine protein kinase/Tol biopolymer transport system component